MTGPVIAGVAVEVVPDARGWVPKFRAAVLPGAGKVGGEYGALFGDEAGKKAAEAFQRGIGKGDPRSQGTRQGDAFGSAFSTQVRKALDNLPKAKLDADATAAERKLDELRTQLGGLDRSVGVHLTDETALRALGQLRLELDRLTLPEHDIRIRMNAHAASAELAAFEAKIAALSNNPDPINATGGGGDGPELSLPSLKATAIVGALPLVGPVAGAASGALLQFAGAAGVAGLAVKGMNNEIEHETPLGKALTAQVTGLSGALTRLEDTAAKGASTGVLSGLKQIDEFMPRLNPLVDSLAQHLGDAFSVATGGVLSALDVMGPLLNDAGRYAELFAGKLAAGARSPEFAHFIDYARAELPVVIDALTELTGSAVHFGEALAPVGTVAIAVLDGLATTLNHIPVTVLTDLAVAATAGYVAFKGYAIISAVNIALTAYSERALIAAGASEALAAANASATLGAGSLAAKFGAASGLVIGLGAVLIGAQQLSKALNDLPASTDVIEKDIAQLGKTSQGTGQLLKDLGTGGRDFAAMGENLFRKSTWTKINDFAPGLDKIGLRVNNVTNNTREGIAAFDKALERMLTTGQKLAAEKSVARAAAEMGVSVDQLKTKLPLFAQALDQITFSGNASGIAASAAADSFAEAGDKFGISGQAAQSYAAIVGLTAADVGRATDGQDRLNSAVAQVAGAYATASQSGSAYLASLSAFAGSEHTAADRAALIGATLRAANGDALAYSGAITSAAGANLALTSAFADQAAQAASNSAAVQAAQAGLTAASSQASRSLSSAVDGVASSERAVTQAQQAALNAQLALTDARKAAKVAAEDLANQVIDGQLSERQAVLSLKAARDALNKPQQGTVLKVGKSGKLLTPKTPTAATDPAALQLSYDQAVQQLAEIRLQNQRLAAQKAASDKAGISGSAQVVSAQQGVAAATQGISDAQRNLAKSQQAVSDAQVAGAQAIANAQRAVTTASAAQTKALGTSELAAINAKTGLIDYGKQGAGPLVQQLQAMQDAAEKAASATFQHEVATKGASRAQHDAAAVYESLTRGALLGEYKQLGLTGAAAKGLADTYFKMPKDVLTTVKAIGMDPIESVLTAIGQQLALLTKEPFEITAHFANAQKTIESLSDAATLLAYIRGDIKHVDIGVSGRGAAGLANGAVMDYYADGGLNNHPASVKHFAGGSENHVAQIAPAGSYRVWAEKETGGEAYIPLGLSKRARSELILAEVARRFGDTLIKGKAGDSRSSVGSMELRERSGQEGGVTVHQTINNPLPERASTTGPKAMRRAAYALDRR